MTTVDRLVLNPDNLSLARDKEEISLLPKEFALLQYLFAHPGRTFSRNALLDAVWPGDNPVDRTVDDHVYRLRRKLQPFSKFLTIETVRGRGYRLTFTELEPTLPKTDALFQQSEFRMAVRGLFQTYYRFGYGEAIQNIARNPELFGTQYDERLDVMAEFIRGDFASFFEKTANQFEDYVFSYLFLHQISHLDVGESLQLTLSALQSKLLQEEDEWEVQCFDLTRLYLYTGQLDAAYQNHLASQQRVEERGWDGYLPALSILGVSVMLHCRGIEAAEQQFAWVEDILGKNPWSRELASREFVLGKMALAKEHWQDAEAHLDEGIRRFDQTGFISNKILNLHKLVLSLDLHPLNPPASLRRKYIGLYEEALRKHGLDTLGSKITQLLKRHLS